MMAGATHIPNLFLLQRTIAELSQLPHAFCTTYLKAVKQLHQDINVAGNIQEMREVLNIFTNKYTTVPNIWVTWRNIEKQLIIGIEAFMQNKKIFETLKNEAIKHFSMGYNFETDLIYGMMFDVYTASTTKSDFSNNEYFEIFKYVKELNYLCEFSSLLHGKPTVHRRFEKREIKNKDYTDFWRTCEEYSTMEIPKKTKTKVEEYILLKESLKDINDDIQWMETLLKNGKNKESIIEFIENRISTNPFNHILWNLYILYLENEQNINVLNVYSRYCRLFIDNSSMRTKYFLSIMKFHKNDENVEKWLLDVVKLTSDFVSINSSINLMKKIFMEIYNETELSEIRDSDRMYAAFKQKIENQNFDSTETEIPKTILRQYFSFPITVIRNMLAVGNASQIQKLQKCCKYFCIKVEATVIHKLSLCKIPQNFMYQNSYFVSQNNIEQFNMERIWLSNALVIEMIPAIVGGINLSKYLFPKIYKCDIRVLSITDHRLTGAEFDYLTKSEGIVSLQLDTTSIKDSDGNEYTLEKIIQRCPNGYSFRLTAIPCTRDTAKILTSLNHKTKIKIFNYSFATEECDVDEFKNFVMLNFYSYQKFYDITKFFRRLLQYIPVSS